MPKCVDQDFPCQNPDYSDFDDTAARELHNPITSWDIFNSNHFCTMVPTDKELQLGELTHKSYLRGLRNKTGIYHLWIDYDNCDDHNTYTMLCVYVGKGLAEIRVDSHIKSKWPPGAELFVTFLECQNRLAKYYEQLFLDAYSFYLNTNENTGTKYLFAVWDEERHLLGTELHEVSNRSGIQGFDDI